VALEHLGNSAVFIGSDIHGDSPLHYGDFNNRFTGLGLASSWWRVVMPGGFDSSPATVNLK